MAGVAVRLGSAVAVAVAEGGATVALASGGMVGVGAAFWPGRLQPARVRHSRQVKRRKRDDFLIRIRCFYLKNSSGLARSIHSGSLRSKSHITRLAPSWNTSGAP